jgi:hypothetical protein
MQKIGNKDATMIDTSNERIFDVPKDWRFKAKLI